jgi:hypothetical protein
MSSQAQVLMNECTKIFDDDIPNVLNLYLVLKGVRDMAILELDVGEEVSTPFHRYVEKNVDKNNTKNFMKVMVAESIQYCEIITKIRKLVLKYNGDVTFIQDDVIFEIAVVRPGFNKWSKLFKALKVRDKDNKGESGLFEMADLLGYPRVPLIADKKNLMSINVVLASKNKKMTRQLYGFKLLNATPINIDRKLLQIKQCLAEVVIKQRGRTFWRIDSIEYTLQQEVNGEVKYEVIKTL